MTRLGRKTSLRDDSATGAPRAEWFYDVLADNSVGQGLPGEGRAARRARRLRHRTHPDQLDCLPTATDITIPAGETGLGGTYSYVNTYNSNGTLYSTRMPAAGDLLKETVEYGYDALGQASTQKSGYGTKAQTDLVAGTGYTSFGELATYRLQNGGGGYVDITRNYDQHTRLLNQIWTTKADRAHGCRQRDLRLRRVRQRHSRRRLGQRGHPVLPHRLPAPPDRGVDSDIGQLRRRADRRRSGRPVEVLAVVQLQRRGRPHEAGRARHQHR